MRNSILNGSIGMCCSRAGLISDRLCVGGLLDRFVWSSGITIKTQNLLYLYVHMVVHEGIMILRYQQFDFIGKRCSRFT